MKITHCYVAYEKCGCITGVVIDNPACKEFIARDIAEFIETDRHVERVALIDFQGYEFGCSCTDRDGEHE